MSTYKVIQDIEAEDKLLGSLTLRQFIYVIIVFVMGFVGFKLASLNILLAIPFLPPMILLGVLASPFSKDQSSEVWLLAKIRFFLKPRKRIWDQSGIIELVTITAPKKLEKILVKNFSQTEVRSRLEALASTIDSRGWAVKNVNVNMFAQPSYVLGQVDSDRLIDPTTMAQEVPTFDVQAVDDMLDERNNPKAQALDQMIASSAQNRKQQVLQNMKNPPAPAPAGQQTPPPDYWFLNETPEAPQKPGYATFDKSQMVQPGTTDSQSANTPAISSVDEQALLEKIHAEKAKPTPGKSHLKTLQPLSEEAVKPAPNPAIQTYVNNDDLDLATISRQVNKTHTQQDDDEVVISLR